MARKRLLTLMLSAIFLLCFVGSALAAGPARRYVGSSTAKGAIYQSSYRVDAQSLTGVKSINISATLYEKGRIGTWQVVSRCSNSSQMQTCVASAIAVFRNKAYIHRSETSLSSQKGKQSEKHVGLHSEEHPVS